MSDEHKIQEYTELGNAKRFTRLSGDDYKWVPNIKNWFLWNKVKWEEDMKSSVYNEIEYVLDTLEKEVEGIVAELSALNKLPNTQVKDSDEFVKAKELRSLLKENRDWALRTQSERVIRATVSLSKSQKGMSVPYEEFDNKGHYLGVKNGIVDLRDGTLVVKDKRYMITKSSSYDYVPGVECPMWLDTLNKAMKGEQDLIDFLQVLLGSGLVGQKSKWFTMFYGEKGGNLKSTIVDTVEELLGDYSMVGDPQVVTQKKSDKQYHLAGYKGVRFLVFNETDKEEVNLSEHLIKMVTDSGKITGRHPMGRPITFQPHFTSIFCVNHLPAASMDPALWRRLLVLPFEYQVPLADQDPDYVSNMVKKEASGIMEWLVKGAQMFLENGLNPPEALTQKTEDIKGDLDIIGQFIQEQCEDASGTKVKLNRLRTEFVTWARANGYKREPSLQTFSRDMRDRGFDVRKSTGNINWVFGLHIDSTTAGKWGKGGDETVTNIDRLVSERNW